MLTALFTALFTKGLIAVLKVAASMKGLKFLAEGLSIYSYFETFRALHECKQVPNCVVEVGYDFLTDSAIDTLVESVVTNRYEVHRTRTGLYAVSQKPILQPRIVYPPIFEWERAHFSEEFVSEWTKASAEFSEQLETSREAFLRSLDRSRREFES